jgi:hypothetical protein
MAKNLKESSKNKVSVPVSVQRDVEDMAYQLWQQRGCPEGSPEEDWFAAEQMLRMKKPEPSRPRVFAAGSTQTES